MTCQSRSRLICSHTFHTGFGHFNGSTRSRLEQWRKKFAIKVKWTRAWSPWISFCVFHVFVAKMLYFYNDLLLGKLYTTNPRFKRASSIVSSNCTPIKIILGQSVQFKVKYSKTSLFIQIFSLDTYKLSSIWTFKTLQLLRRRLMRFWRSHILQLKLIVLSWSLFSCQGFWFD